MACLKVNQDGLKAIRDKLQNAYDGIKALEDYFQSLDMPLTYKDLDIWSLITFHRRSVD